MVVEQIKVGFDNFSYIIYDAVEKESSVVDPSFDSDVLSAINGGASIIAS